MNETLNAMYNSFEIDANHIDGWKEMSKTELANGYCDADESGDFITRDRYLSCLMCKYWYMIKYLHNQSKSCRVDIEDMVSWVEEAILKGLSYRRWRDPNFAVSKDINGAEKVFNRCFWSIRNYYYRYFNKDKRKLNYSTTYSLDALQESFKDSVDYDEDSEFELIENDSYEKKVDSINTCKDIVNYYFKKNKYLFALIIDSICFHDSYKSETEKSTYECDGEVIESKSTVSVFSPKKVISQMKSLTINDLINKYKCDITKLTNCIEEINKSSSKKLYTYIEEALNDLKHNNEVNSILF